MRSLCAGTTLRILRYRMCVVFVLRYRLTLFDPSVDLLRKERAWRSTVLAVPVNALPPQTLCAIAAGGIGVEVPDIWSVGRAAMAMFALSSVALHAVAQWHAEQHQSDDMALRWFGMPPGDSTFLGPLLRLRALLVGTPAAEMALSSRSPPRVFEAAYAIPNMRQVLFATGSLVSCLLGMCRPRGTGEPHGGCEQAVASRLGPELAQSCLQRDLDIIENRRRARAVYVGLPGRGRLHAALLALFPCRCLQPTMSFVWPLSGGLAEFTTARR